MAKKALCIGINNYPGTQMDLQGCVNDAADWNSALTSRGFKVTTLIDDAATKQAMLDAMGALISKAVKGDSLVITFSGHGTYMPDTDGDEADGFDEALCTYDITTHGPLNDDEIKALFATRKAGVSLVLIADSCHSGTVTRAAKADKDSDTRARFMPMGNWLPLRELPKNRAGKPATSVLGPIGTPPLQGLYSRVMGDVLLAGCKEGPNNYSYDARINGRFNGAFTYHALKTLKTLKPEATYADWHKAIIKYLPSSSYPQAPQLFASEAARQRIVFA
ncbi:caspase family protein [Rhodoferax sp. U2-2l]|uniref:caspase family protein n=1 Tax=Rhodoferax sp. U2-2l TaxID=2884000 RepID=UPI001D0AEF2C|nr:caspase family protein [Rhodoferax sp. U2-2l]MCB8746260.1 caspase family protein [Rhodoferax sp. U2-2l]